MHATAAAEPPGPLAWPFVGSMLQLRGDPLARVVALRARYGGIVRLGPLGVRDVYLVTDPAAVRHVLLDNHTGYRKGLSARRLRPILGNGSLLLEGPAWRQRRRLVQPAFHKQKIASLAATFVAATDAMLDRWHGARIGMIDARHEMLQLTMGLTLRNMFGAEAQDLGQLIEAWQALYDELSRRRPRILRRANDAERALATVHRILGDLIRGCAHTDDDGSLLAMLVAARAEGDERLSEAELRDEVITIFIGGYETSSNALAFAIALLAAEPEVAARHRAEVDAVLSGRTPELGDLAAMPYHRAILDETLRLYPPSWMITREALADDVVGGFRIARGSQLLISSYAVHHAPELWAHCDRFDPERFLPGGPERDRFAYLPFGGGPRVCLGDQYALVEMQLVLARLAQRTVLALAPGCRIAARAHIGLRPRDPLRILVRSRAA